MGNNHCDMLYLCIGNRKSDGNSRYSERNFDYSESISKYSERNNSNSKIKKLKNKKNYGIGIEFDKEHE